MHYLQAELYELVRRDRHIFDFLQEGSLDGVWYWDIENPEEEWMSEAFWRLFGYDPTEMPHRADAWQDIINQDDLKTALENFHRHCEDPDFPYDQIVRYKHRDGSTVTVRCRGTAIRDETGKVVRMLGAHTDLTELKKTEEALRNANDQLARERDRAEAASSAKSTFLATMSHEIRTPLNGVLGMAGALATTQLSATQSHMVDIINESGARLLALLNDILDLSKIEAGEMSVEPVRFDPAALCQEIANLYEQDVAGRPVSLYLDTSGVEGKTLRAGAPRIRQVLGNLVSNALKFTSRGSVDVIATLEPAENGREMLILTVRDTGIGITRDQKERIFEAFIQAGPEIGVEFGGTGLGLAISRSICRNLGGSLRLEDTPGGGATFIASFQVENLSETLKPAEAENPAARMAGLPPLSLLIAEDNEINQLVLRALLETAPVTLQFVENGREALEALQAGTFDAALVDIRMPVLSGIDVARTWREQERSQGRARLPLVAFTANVMDDQRNSYHEAGFDQMLAKPLDIDRLSECLMIIADGQRHSGAA